MGNTPPYGVRTPGSGPTKVSDPGSGPAPKDGAAPHRVRSMGSGPNPLRLPVREEVRDVGSGPARDIGSGPTKAPAVPVPVRDPVSGSNPGSNGSGSNASSPTRLMLPSKSREPAVHVPGPEAGPQTQELLVRDDKAGEIFFVKHTVTDVIDQRLVLARQRDSARAASFRQLRQRLVEAGDPRVILVTSPRSREGKTISATNLALAYAELGRSRVLIVEANFRSASLGEVFGFKPPRSFSAQLERHRDHPIDPWVVVQVAPIDVHVMAVNPNCCPACSTVLVKGANFCPSCGRPVSNEPPRLDRTTFASAIRRLKEAFDYVIIDGPSVLESADVNLIQDTADGIVMTARSGHTDARALKRAMDQVSPAPVLGVVLVED